MSITPKIRGFICTNANKDGCRANVAAEISWVKEHPRLPIQGKNALIIGCSAGYGLSSRIAAAYGGGCATLGVQYERPESEKRTASAGYYNSEAFIQFAAADGLFAETINGDAFTDEVKVETIAALKRGMGKADIVVYSLGAPVRTDPVDGVSYRSCLKPVGGAYTSKNIDLKNKAVTEITIEPATDEEITATVKVMGGEDLRFWIDALVKADALSNGAQIVAYSYIGPALTHAIYKDGTIGMAKQHLERTVAAINRDYPNLRAFVSVNKAVVTTSSSAIPVVPLYISILYKLMKEKGVHEDCIQQEYRLFRDYLLTQNPLPLDEAGRIRIDDLEMSPEIQAEVAKVWQQITTENLSELADIAGYEQAFLKLYGF